MTGLGQLNYVASCRSSTTEGASDVSPSHLFHLASGTCRVFGFVLCVVFWLCLFLVLVSRVLHVQEASF